MQKDIKLGITKDKLIDATFALMEEADDPLNVTSRQIAERAGTKPSMREPYLSDLPETVPGFPEGGAHRRADRVGHLSQGAFEEAPFHRRKVPCGEPQVHKGDLAVRAFRARPVKRILQLPLR